MTRHAARLALLLAAVAGAAGCTPAGDDAQPELVATIVEAACGQCQFGLPGEGCELAVRINGTAYFVDGTGIDDHGDAHAADGFCSAVREARVTGRVVDGRFAATSFDLIAEDGE